MLDEAYERLSAAYGPQHWWPGESAIEIIVGAVLTQNTNWKNVELAIEKLRVGNFLSLDRLVQVESAELEELIRSAGYFRLKTQRLKNLVLFISNQFGSVEKMFRSDQTELREQLLNVNGIGPETADSILLYAGNYPTFVVDAYTARIAKRHDWIDREAKYASLKALFESNLPRDVRVFNEYHALIVQVGKFHCRPTPVCDGCPLQPMLPKTGMVEI